MKKHTYFTLEEICRSHTAQQLGIDNQPSEEILDNIDYLMDCLDEIRSGYGKPIFITSGFRCEELNKAVGGVKNSFHTRGLAVDIRWDTDLISYIIENHTFDKLIREKSGATQWIHLQFQKDKEKNRNQVFSLFVS